MAIISCSHFLFNLCEAVGSVSSSLKKRNGTVLNEIKEVSSHQAGCRARPFNRITSRLLSLSLQPSSTTRTSTWTWTWVCTGAVEFAGLRAGGDGEPNGCVKAGAEL